MTVTALEGGRQTLEVVGESFYADSLDLLVDALAQPHHETRGDRRRVPIHAMLVADTDNQYDDNSISVWINGHKVGHLSREDAALYRPGLLKLQRKHDSQVALDGIIIGRPGIHGVFLNVDPGDFGIDIEQPHTVVHATGQVRTGLSDAIATDLEDDSYDLSWVDDLPTNVVKRIPKLRELLVSDSDPISRHFIFTVLEEDLYSCRDLWESALADYDEVTEIHHAEILGGTKDALLQKFGAIPLIETYKQAAIRNQKARRWEASLRWAERGLAVYGDDAAVPEAVEDLNKRVERARAKLGSLDDSE